MPVPRIVAGDQSLRRRWFLGTRVPPNLFAIALGLAGLAQAWQAAVPVLGIPQAVPEVLSVLGATVWLVLVGAYLAQGPVSSWPTSATRSCRRSSRLPLLRR